MQMIQSRTSETVKALVRLRDSAAQRERQGYFLAEGLRLCTDLAAVWTPRQVYATQAALDAHPALAGLGPEPCLIAPTVAEKLSDTKSTQGVFGVFPLPGTGAPLKKGGRYLALEHVQDPSNVGALMRSAAAFGFDGVLLCSHCADPFSPKALRACMGTVPRLALSWYDSVPQMARELRAAGIPLIAAALRRAVPLDSAQTALQAGAAVLVGNEGNGLTDEAVDCADITVRIPMAPGVESLNAAVAGSVLLWHFRGSVCGRT